MRNGKLFPSTCDANSWNISHNSQHLRFSSQSTQHESSSFRAAREATSPTRKGEWGAGWDEQTSTSVNFIQLFIIYFSINSGSRPLPSLLPCGWFLSTSYYLSFSPIHSHFLCDSFLAHAHAESSQILVYEIFCFFTFGTLLFTLLVRTKKQKQMKMS